MKRKTIKWLKKLFFPALIISLTAILAWVNYEPGTWLSGWDTLHPEFNFPLYLKRAFSGAWQEHQGVGASASQAHAAEIPRLLIVYLLSLVLPISGVRHAFFFLTLAVGALGTYYFINYVLNQKGKFSYVNSASFLGALFYLLNLATLQQYYVPLEMFAVHFATLPWIILMAISFLEKGAKKDVFWFGMITIFAASMAHTATLFYVYLGALTVFIALVILTFRKRQILKRGITLVSFTLILNAFWLFPNIYYIANHAQEVEQSKIHTIFTDEAFLQGKSFGNLADLALFKNFLFNWREFDTTDNTFVDLMDEWILHLDGSWVKEIGYALFGFALLGFPISLFRKSKYGLVLFPLFAIGLFFWINSNPPFAQMFEYLRENSSLFGEGLRFPFTKFSILLTFVTAVYFSFSTSFFLEKVKKVWLSPAFFLAITASIVFFMLPAFKGNLISPSMKVEFSSEYFEAFDWLQKQDPTARVAKLPLHTFWGWNFYSWDYQGAGFSWFGIPQPTLDREFDRWSSYNETFYNQLSLALYSHDLTIFEEVLQKYGVRFLFLDESILNAGGNKKLLAIPQIKDLLNQSEHVNEEVKFGFLTIYRTDFELGDKFISVPKSFAKVNADLTYSPIDPIYSKYGTYVQDEEGISYPFVNLDKREEVQAQIEGDKIVFINESKEAKVFLPIENPVIESFGPERGFGEAYNCDLKKKGSVAKENLGNKIFYGAYDGGVSCDFFYYSDLEYSQGYVLRVKGENKTGRSLKIYLQNLSTNRMDLEELLPNGVFDEDYFILPKDIEGSGYTLNIETRSFGRVASENVLEAIELYPVPINWLINLYSDTERDIYSESRLEILGVNKWGTAHYLIETKGDGLIVLGQGFENGWLAFPWLPDKKLEHVKVNSWANGWNVPGNQHQIIIVYWPQYLQYLGLLLGFSGFIWGMRKVVDKEKAQG